MSNWTEPRIADVRRLAALRWSAADIAAELGDGITRMAVIGVARRNSIPLMGGLRGPDRKPRPARRAALNMAKVQRLAGQASAPAATPAPPKGNPIEFMELTNWTCRWPIGETYPYAYCGTVDADCTGGRPYCRECSELAYGRRMLEISDADRERRSHHGFKMLAAGNYVAGHSMSIKALGPK